MSAGRPAPNAGLLEVPLDHIRAEGNIRNFRVDDEHGRGLRDSVRHLGILQPVLLTPLPKALLLGVALGFIFGLESAAILVRIHTRPGSGA